MKRIISIVLASAMTATCAACLSGCGGGASADSADAGEVNVYNWGEYISNGEDDSLDIIKEFEKRTNIISMIDTAGAEAFGRNCASHLEERGVSGWRVEILHADPEGAKIIIE